VKVRDGVAAFACSLNRIGSGYTFGAAPRGGGADGLIPVKSNFFNIAVPTITLAPVSLPDATVGQSFEYALTASGGSAGYTFAVTGGALPPGLSLSGDGHLKGTPTAAGSFSFHARARDRNKATGSRTFTLSVKEPAKAAQPAPPVNSSLPTATVGQSYDQDLKALSGVSTSSVKLTGGSPPPGLTLAGDGHLHGTPTTTGTYEFTVTATDKSGAASSRSYTLAVVAPQITVAPSALPAATVGQSYNQELKASGGAGGYVYTVSGGGLPAGLTLTSDGHVTGTPTTAGTFPFTVTATDKSRSTGSQAITLTVAAPQITIGPSALPAATVGQSYGQQVKAAGGAGGYVYSVSGGSLPPGLTLGSDGRLQGKPTKAGTYSFTVTATDKNNASGSQGYTLTVS
jgi:hypothetical protein